MKLIFNIKMMNIVFKFFIVFLCVFMIENALGQNIAITDEDGHTPHSSAMLDVYSTSKGLLVPRLNSSQQDALIGGAATGLLIFNTDEGKYSFYNGSGWEIVGSNNTYSNGLTLSSNNVKLGGSLSESTEITQGTNNMIFNLNSSGDFNIQDNGTSAFYVKDDGKIGMGTTIPTEKLHIEGNTTVNGNAYITGNFKLDGISLEGSSNCKFYRNLATYNYGGFSNGAIVINTSHPSDQYCMIRIKIEGFLYSPQGPFEITTGFWWNSGSSDGGFVNVGLAKFPISTAVNSNGNLAIVIGDEASSFGYPNITVTEYMQGYSNFDETYAESWTINTSDDFVASGLTDLDELSDQTLVSPEDYLTSSEVTSLISDIDYFNKVGSHITQEDTLNNLSIGTATETGKLLIQGTSSILDTAIFEVKNKSGQTVFAVYPEGVRVYVNDNPQKAIGNKGGFAVGGFSSGKGLTDDYLIISRDSSRLYYDPFASKAAGNKGGFAVGGFSSGKGAPTSFMDMSVENYFIGHESGIATTTGQYNTFFGYQTGMKTTTGRNNVFIGYHVGQNNIGGTYNTFVGSESGVNNESGNFNSFFGNYAGHWNKAGDYNTYLGFYAGMESGLTEGDNASHNTMVGFYAGKNNRNGDKNVFLGFNAGNSNSDASYGVFIGSYAGYDNTIGASNIFIGNESGRNNTTGDNNLFIGYRAGYYNETGEFNTNLGYQSGYYSGYGTVSVDPSYNTFVGYQAGYNNRYGAYNTYIGYRAGWGTGYVSTTSGSNNVAIGYDAGYDLTTGHDNVFLGYYSGNNNSTGNYNVFIGRSAGKANTSAQYNSFIGYQAGEETTTGGYNTMMGYLAGNKNTTGVNQAFFGYNAGYENTGSHNTFVGSEAGYLTEAGADNVYIGMGAGRECEGSANVFIGSGAGKSETTASNKLIIENTHSWGDDYETISLVYGDFASDWLRINGNLKVNGTAFHIENNPGSGSTPTNYVYQGSSTGSTEKEYAFTIHDALWVTSTAWSDGWYSNSDKRLKKNIKNINNPISLINQINGVYYEWIDDKANKNTEEVSKFKNSDVQIGFIAQEVEKFIPEIVFTDGEGYKSVDYSKMTAVLLEAIKEQQKQIEELKSENISKTEEIQSLKSQIDKIESIQNQLNKLETILNTEASK
jgi:trimeric autotransporter adhesin